MSINKIETIIAAMNEYVIHSREVMEKHGDKITIVTPTSATVFSKEESDFYVKNYLVDDNRNLVSHKHKLKDYTTLEMMKNVDVLSLDQTSFNTSSHFLDVPYESAEIFQTIRMINIQAFRIHYDHKIDRKKELNTYEIKNSFPSCDYSEIKLDTTNGTDIDLEITFKRRIYKFNHIDEMRNDTFTNKLTIKYGQDNIEALYDAFMELYMEYLKRNYRE